MEKNNELKNVLGRIYQLTNYKIFKEEELNEIQLFCDEMKQKLNAIVWDYETVDLNNFKIFRQSDIDADYVLKLSKDDECQNESDSGEVPPPVILNWMDKYQRMDGMIDKYRMPLEISREVAEDIFKDITFTKAKVFLGEDEKGIVFLLKDIINGTYFIISNTMQKQEITEQNFEDYKQKYYVGLKVILDDYIIKETGNVNARNTKRFILGRKIYENLIKSIIYNPNAVIVFYPVIYLLDDYLQYQDDNEICIQVKHRYRLTFLMTIEKYIDEGRVPILTEGVYDRNGLCPPPDNSNC